MGWFRKKNKGEGGVGTGVSSGQFAAKVQTAPGLDAQLRRETAGGSVASTRYGFGPKVASAVRPGDLIDHEGEAWEVVGRTEQRNNPGWVDGENAPLRFQIRHPEHGTQALQVRHGSLMGVATGGAAKRWQIDQLKKPMQLRAD